MSKSSIIIVSIIVVIAIILYFLFIKKHITIASPTTSSTFSSPIVTQTSSPITSSPIVTQTSTSITSSSISTSTPMFTVYNTCGSPISFLVSYPSQTTFVDSFYVLNSQQSVPINYEQGMTITFYTMSGGAIGQLLTPILPNQTLVTPPGCPSATSPPSTQTQIFAIADTCNVPVLAYIHYPTYPAFVSPFVIFPSQTPNLFAGYTQGMYIEFKSTSGQNLGTVYPSSGQQKISPQVCPS